MARLIAGGTLADVVIDIDSNPLGPGQLLLYTDQALTLRVTDLQDLTGAAMSSVPVDLHGRVAQFKMPSDGTSALWAAFADPEEGLPIPPAQLILAHGAGGGGGGGTTDPVVTPPAAMFPAGVDHTSTVQGLLSALDGTIGGTVLLPVLPGTQTYRLDGTLVITARKALELPAGVELWRRSASSAATTPLVVLNGNNAKLDGHGLIQTENASPAGVLVIGEVADTVTSRCAMTSGSATLTAELPVFTAGMIGWAVGVNGAGAAGARLVSTISAYTDANTVTLAATASTTVTHVRTLAGTGGVNVNWCWAGAVSVTGRNAAAGSGDIGIKFNSYPQGLGIGVFQNQVTGPLVYGVDYGVVFGPEANGNEANGVRFYNIKTAPIWFNNGDENSVAGGFISQSPNVTCVMATGCSLNIVEGLKAEPGGSSARGWNLDADTNRNSIWVQDNVALGSIDASTLGVNGTSTNSTRGNFTGPAFNGRTLKAGALQLGDVGAAAAASATTEGMTRVVYGNPDVLQICLKTAAGGYTWVTVTTGDAAGVVPPPQYDSYTANGTFTWTKPSGAVRVEVIAIASGAGGGSGRRGAAGGIRCGGGGGAGAIRALGVFKASDLGATEPVIVGPGGAGGAAQTTDTTDGLPGGAGSVSSFGSSTNRWVASHGPAAGLGGTATTGGSATAAGPGGAAGSAASTTGGAGVSANSATGRGSFSSAGAGASGGGIVAGNTDSAGGSGSISASGSATGATAGPASSNTPGGAGAAARSNSRHGGAGGAGGGSSSVSAAGAGGPGGGPGGGGGGGGASLNGNASGAGGAGADGAVYVITYFG